VTATRIFLEVFAGGMATDSQSRRGAARRRDNLRLLISRRSIFRTKSRAVGRRQ